jgi:hypothetical protein
MLKCRLGMGLLACALVLCAAPVPAAEPERYLPDDTELVLVVNVQQILAAPLVQKYVLGPIKEVLTSNPETQQVLQELGFDPLKDVTRITAAVPGLTGADKGVLILQGRFQTAKFHAKALEVAKSQGDVLKVHSSGSDKIYEVLPPSQSQAVFVGLVDENTLVAGSSKAYILDAFAKKAGTKETTLKKDLAALIEKIDSKQSIWLAVPGSTLGKSELTQEERAKKTLEKIAALTVGLTLADNIVANIAITAKTAEAAGELAKEMKEGLEQAKGLVTVLSGSQKELAPVADFLGAIKTSTEGNTILLQGGVSAETLEKALKKGG